MKTKVLDVRALTEDTLRRAQVLREPEAIAIVEAALEKIREAAETIRRGGLVAFPTETVYGLGADAFNVDAVSRVYEAKGRPSDNPMIAHIARASDMGLLTRTLSPGVVKLADAFWPGPLTIILEKRPEVPRVTTGGLPTIGIRLPDSPVAIELIRAAGVPVAAPSANLSGGPSPTRAEHVIADLDGRVEIILAGPDCRVGIESTVVDMTTRPPAVLRPGILSAEDLSAAMGTLVEVDPALLKAGPDVRLAGAGGAGAGSSMEASTGSTGAGGSVEASTGSMGAGGSVEASTGGADMGGSAGAGGEAPRAPGMKYRHYAPNAEMIVVEGMHERVKPELYRLRAMNESLGRHVALLLFDEKDYLEAAQTFYTKLRELDAAGFDLILAGALSRDDGVGFAVMNRMMKAAGHRVVRV